MIASVEFEGRLGNVLFEIANTFIFAKQQGISESNVFFKRTYCTGNGIEYCDEVKAKPKHLDYLSENKEILIPVQDRLLSDEEWGKLTGPIVYSPYGCSKAFAKRNLWKGLFSGLFYDESTFAKHRNSFPEYYDKPDNTTALHVRRSDYAVFRDGKWLQSKESVQASIDANAGKLVVVFSDDIEWCKSNLVEPPQGRIVFHPTTEIPACSDMIVLSNFKNIIPNENSTYSWFSKKLSEDLVNTGKMYW